jgi:peptide/nickel transport system substrate-binding protein
MRRTRSVVTLALGAALVLSSCSNGSDNSSGEPDDPTSDDGGQSSAPPVLGEAGGTVTMAVTDDPGNLDPSMTVLAVARGMTRVAYDSLVRLSPEGEVVPSMATEWELTDSSVTFTLNPDVQCSDGSTFTATDAADNINYIADPENASPLLGVILPAGAQAEADDDAGTVTVSVPEPNAFLLRSLTSVFMICRAGLDDHEALAQETIGTGPWILEEVVPNDSYTFSRNPNYAWGPNPGTFEGEGVPDELIYRIIPNLTTTTNLLLAGDVNVAAVGSGDEARVKEAGLSSYGLPAPLGELFFNQGPDHPGSDPEVRRALVSASNMELLMTVATGESGQLSKGLVTLEPKACPGDTVTGNLPAFDVAGANQILDDAGWVRGADGVREKDGQRLAFTFIFAQRGGDELSAAAELLAQQWAEVGAEVTPQVIAATQLNEVIFASGNWDAGWIPVTLSLPSQLPGFVSGPTPPDGTNFAYIENETYDEASAEALTTGDVEAACTLWNEAETALIAEGDVVPMFDIIANTYLNKVTLEAPGGDIDGASIRTTT